jgi:hypothetical protein
MGERPDWSSDPEFWERTWPEDESEDLGPGLSVHLDDQVPPSPMADVISDRELSPLSDVQQPGLDEEGYPTVRQSAGSVRERFLAILGSEIHQSTLKALREGLFKDILPPMQRNEKRKWCENLMAFESHRERVLARLDDPACVRAVVHMVLNGPNERQRESVFAHATKHHLL